MAQARRRRRLPLGAGGRLALAGDDLEGDIETRPLVAGEPHRARPSAPERTKRPVATEDGLAFRKGERGAGHRSSQVGDSRRISSPSEGRLQSCPTG